MDADLSQRCAKQRASIFIAASRYSNPFLEQLSLVGQWKFATTQFHLYKLQFKNESVNLNYVFLLFSSLAIRNIHKISRQISPWVINRKFSNQEMAIQNSFN